jgi:hypothetical protein
MPSTLAALPLLTLAGLQRFVLGLPSDSECADSREYTLPCQRAAARARHAAAATRLRSVGVKPAGAGEELERCRAGAIRACGSRAWAMRHEDRTRLAAFAVRPRWRSDVEKRPGASEEHERRRAPLRGRERATPPLSRTRAAFGEASGRRRRARAAHRFSPVADRSWTLQLPSMRFSALK